MIEFDGWEEAGRELDEFADGLIRIPNRLDMAYELATADTAKEVTRKAKRNVRVDQGDLKRSINWHKVADQHYVVGTDEDHGPSIEFGTRPHAITPNTADALSFSVNGEQVVTQSADHPGHEAYPFLRPAMDSARKNFRQRLKDKTKNVFDSVF